MNLRHAAVILIFFVYQTVRAADGEVRILLVSAKPDHAWGTHMYAFECALLAKCLNQTPGVQATAVPTWPPDDDLLAGVRSVVFYSSPAGEIVLAPDNRQQFQQLMARHVGFVAIHWATGVGYSKPADDPVFRHEYQNVLGGWFRRPPCEVKIGRSPLKQIDDRHPICRGWNGWQIHDEFYLNPVLHDNALPLLEVIVEGQRQVVGWTFHRHRQGRSVGITLGHFHHNFARADFRRLLVNSVLWSAHVEVPATGANVDVGPDQLDLPPEKEP